MLAEVDRFCKGMLLKDEADTSSELLEVRSPVGEIDRLANGGSGGARGEGGNSPVAGGTLVSRGRGREDEDNAISRVTSRAAAVFLESSCEAFGSP